MSGFFSSLMPLCVAQAWLLALLAAQKDDRLALLHLGHVHHRGLHGFLTDPDLAYAYYANIAKQTTLDRQNLTPQQVMYAFVAGRFGMHVLFRMESNTVLPHVVPKATIALSISDSNDQGQICAKYNTKCHKIVFVQYILS